MENTTSSSTTSFAELVENERPFITIMDRYFSLPICILGILGNIASAVIWSTRSVRRQNSSAYFLVTLSLNDLSFLILYFIFDLHWAWRLSLLDHPVICEIFSALFIIPQYASPAIVCAFSIDRYLFVGYPFWRRRFSNHKFVIAILIGIFGLSLFCAWPEAIFWTTSHPSHPTATCTNRDEARAFLYAWSIVTASVFFTAVPVLNLGVNIALIREIIEINSRHELSLKPAGGSSHNLTEAGNGSERCSLDKGQSLRMHHHRQPNQHRIRTATLLAVSFYLILTQLPLAIIFIVTESLIFRSTLSSPSLPLQPGKIASIYDTITGTTGPGNSSSPAFNESSSAAMKSAVDFHLQSDADQLDAYVVRRFFEEIALTHFAVNFLVYVLTGNQFRQLATDYFVRGRCNKAKHRNSEASVTFLSTPNAVHSVRDKNFSRLNKRETQEISVNN